MRDRWLVPDSIGYLAIDSFGERAQEARAVELVRTRYLRALALIVDVRGNGGGNTPRLLTETLLDGKPYVWWKEDPNRAPMSAFDRMGAAMRRLGGVQPIFVEFDNGITISASAKRAHFPDGSEFEGVGIAPDVLVPRTRADIASGADRALDAALALARQRPLPR